MPPNGKRTNVNRKAKIENPDERIRLQSQRWPAFGRDPATTPGAKGDRRVHPEHRKHFRSSLESDSDKFDRSRAWNLAHRPRERHSRAPGHHHRGRANGRGVARTYGCSVRSI